MWYEILRGQRSCEFVSCQESHFFTLITCKKYSLLLSKHAQKWKKVLRNTSAYFGKPPNSGIKTFLQHWRDFSTFRFFHNHFLSTHLDFCEFLAVKETQLLKGNQVFAFAHLQTNSMAGRKLERTRTNTCNVNAERP